MKTREILPLVGSVVQVVTVFGSRITGRLDGVGKLRFGTVIIRLGGGVRFPAPDEAAPKRIVSVVVSVCTSIREADAHEVDAWREADSMIAAADRGEVVVP